jgi:hypothetical protein
LNTQYKTIPIKDLKPSQEILSDRRIEKVRSWMKAGSDFSVVAFYENGAYYIYDGHHRAYYWYKLNQETIKIELIEKTKEVIAALELLPQHSADTLAQLTILPHHRFKQLLKGFKEE